MERPGSSSGCQELQCVGRLEIARPKPAGFLCGSIPVTTDDVHEFYSAALVRSPHMVRPPRYQMIPTETDLNSLPLPSSIPERVLPVSAAQSRTNDDSPWQGSPITPSLARKGEALAVSGLVEYGDQVDVIAPADILKQIFKIPYSKTRVSIAVHRVGQTLVLNTGPDIEEGEKLIRRHNRQPQCIDESLFLNFAMHSVRMEACDCPPSYSNSSDENFKSPAYRAECMSNEGSLQYIDHLNRGHASSRQGGGIEGKEYANDPKYGSSEKEKLIWGKKKKKNSRQKSSGCGNKVADMKEKPRCPVQESEKYRRVGDDGFLRVYFLQFHNFRMLLGSDLLIFSNEKYVAVSLHLWDVSRKVTPLAWLEAWLDNFLASVPELAICYHQDGVVQGYELLKTDDIFLLKGISDDGTPAFEPHVVQQNGLSVLKFLEENCKQDPGAYWLHKSSGEDVIQLFDLSVIPKNHTTDGCHDSSDALPSLIYGGRSDSILSLGTLLYRIAHRLSLTMSPKNRVKCAGFFQKCLNFLDEPRHLVVRALAHEEFARLLLTYDEDLELTPDVLPMEPEVIITESEEESSELMHGLSSSRLQDIVCTPVMVVTQPESAGNLHNVDMENSTEMSSGHNSYTSRMHVGSNIAVADEKPSCAYTNESMPFCFKKASNVVTKNATDPLPSKLAAIHHVSQAIKSLRWTRKLQNTRHEQNLEREMDDHIASAMDFSVCSCGDSDCIEVCDIREWLPTSKIDDKLLKLVLLLGESYLALGQAYTYDGQLYEALKVIELACLIYGSVPRDAGFISTMVSSSLAQAESNNRSEKTESSSNDFCLTFDGFSSSCLFWSKAWTLVGDVFIEFYLIKGQEVSRHSKRKKHCTKDLKMSSEVLKEVERLKKKMQQYNRNCSVCSLMNCSCQSDRVSSGSSASCSTKNTPSPGFGRKKSKKLPIRNNPHSRTSDNGNDFVQKGYHMSIGQSENVKQHKIDVRNETCEILDGIQEINLGTNGSEREHNNHAESAGDASSEPSSIGETTTKIGGIFKYLRGSTSGDVDYMLSVSLNCFDEAQKTVYELPAFSSELQSILKKKGWVCNELGRIWVERKDLSKAETAFVEAIHAFRHVNDHTNIILIYCNLGHGRRALAEDMISKIDGLKKHARLQGASLPTLDAAKLQYSEALWYYGAAKTELNSLAEKASSASTSLKNEVSTQFAHTYLKLGMLLARQNTVAQVYENCDLDNYAGYSSIRSPKEHRKHEISANDAIREALSLYESLGNLRKQEAAYAHFQLACYQRDCCLRFLESDQHNNLTTVDNAPVQRVKQYASLAERNWQKSMEFYGPKTHPMMFLTILVDMSALTLNLSNYLHSTMLLESALTCLLRGRHIAENLSMIDVTTEVCEKFWGQLQMLLKNMLTAARKTKVSKYTVSPQQSPSSKSADTKKLSELYRMSLKSTDFHRLHLMHSLWAS